jgi:predicted DNA-binding transcriptional regulator YafY
MILINRERITARELAERLEVSVRTIHRDMEAIGLAGIPVVSFAGRNGGFGVVDSFRLDRSILTANDVLTILTALRGMSTALNDRQTALTLEKLRSIASVPDSPLPNLRSDVQINLFPAGVSRHQVLKLSAIRRALNESRVISFGYTSARGECTTRIVEPVTLVLNGQHWYMYGYCRLRSDYRLFRLTRMRDVAVLDEVYEKHRLDPGALDWSELKDMDAPVEKVHLRFDRQVYSRVCDAFDAETVADGPDNCVEVTVEWPVNEWLHELILSFGPSAEVIAPQSLRDTIRSKAEAMLRRYEKDAG